MISEWFLTLAAGFVAWLGDLFPSWEPPAEFTQFQSMVADVMTWFVGLGAWFPIPVLAACVGIQLSTWGIVVLTKTARALASHIPFVGGAGA